MKQNGVKSEEVGYIGDDVNDIAVMELCGLVACPADAIDDVKQVSDYVSKVNGGHGVVRDVISCYLREQGLWEKTIRTAYKLGT